MENNKHFSNITAIYGRLWWKNNKYISQITNFHSGEFFPRSFLCWRRLNLLTLAHLLTLSMLFLYSWTRIIHMHMHSLVSVHHQLKLQLFSFAWDTNYCRESLLSHVALQNVEDPKLLLLDFRSSNILSLQCHLYTVFSGPKPQLHCSL